MKENYKVKYSHYNPGAFIEYLWNLPRPKEAKKFIG